MGTEGPVLLKKQHAWGEAELEGEGGGVAEGGGRGHVVEDGAQGAGEGGSVGGVDVLIIIRRRGGRSLHDPLQPDVDASVPGEGGGAAGAVPVAEGVKGTGLDIETKAASALEGVELGGREEVEVPIEGDGDVAVGPKGVDDGLEGGAEAVVAAPGGGRGNEVLVDGKAEGGRDVLVDLDEEDAGGRRCGCRAGRRGRRCRSRRCRA